MSYQGEPSFYEEKLRDPRWLRVAFKVKCRDRFCQHPDCRLTKRLEVHHLKYTTPDPWDEPMENLITYCHRHHMEKGHGVQVGNVNQAFTLACSLVKRADAAPTKTAQQVASEEVMRNFYYNGR
jgi:hypothetical protein